MALVGEFHCLRCQHEWSVPQRVGQAWSVQTCPKCDHLYVKWVNYDQHKW